MDIINYIKNAASIYWGKKEGYSYIEKKVGIWEAFLTVYLITIIGSIIGMAVNSLLNLIDIILLIFGSALGIIIGTFIGYGIFYLFLKVFGGKGGYLETIKFGLSISILPSLIMLIFNFFPKFYSNKIMEEGITASSYNLIIGITAAVIGSIMGIWALVVSIRTYSKLHKISYIRTIFAILIPIIIIAIIGILLLTLLVLSIGAPLI